MAYLEELLPELRKGAKIRCDYWDEGKYIQLKEDGYIYDNEDDKAPVIVGIFTSHEDIDSPADNALVAEAARLAYENVN